MFDPFTRTTAMMYVMKRIMRRNVATLTNVGATLSVRIERARDIMTACACRTAFRTKVLASAVAPSVS